MSLGRWAGLAVLAAAAGCRGAAPTETRPDPPPVARAEGAKTPLGERRVPPAGPPGVPLAGTEHERAAILSGGAPVWVEGEVRDAFSRRRIPARVLVEDGGGTEPGAVLAGLGFWCPGAFTVRAIPGRLRLTISAGRRRIAFARERYARPLERVRLRAELASPPDLRLEERGWFGVDLFRPLGVQGALREKATLELLALAARAEGVSFCGVAPPWGGLSAAEVARRCAELSGEGLALAPVARGNDAPFYGSAFFLGMENPGALERERWDLRRPNFLAFEDCRARGGASVLVGIADTRGLDPQSEVVALAPGLAEYYRGAGLALDGGAWELPFDAVGGTLPDALALSGSPAEEAVWFRLLKMGFRLCAVFVEKGSLAEGTIPAERTFVRLGAGEEPTARAVASAIRAGRVMATGGPFVFLTIAGQEPGGVLRADGAPRVVRFEAYSSTERDGELTALELVRNGEVVESVPGEGRTSIVATLAVRERETCWYIARARAGRKNERRAWTGPIYFEAAGWTPPRAVLTNVRGRITDASTGRPLGALVEARFEGRLVSSAVADAASGAYALSAPPASLVVASCAGYAPASTRVFFHTRAGEEIRAMHTNSTGRGAAVLAEERTYELMRLACAEAEIDLRLEPSSGGR